MPTITIVGAGISSPDQITQEGDAALRAADLVFYLLDLNPASTVPNSLGPELFNLDLVYQEGRLDTEAYDDITRMVVFAAAVRQRTALWCPDTPASM